MAEKNKTNSSFLTAFGAKISFRYRRLKKKILKFKEFYKLYKSAGSRGSFFGSLKYFNQWNKTFAANRGPLADETPWIVYDSLKFLQGIVTKEMKVFEYGTGGSSAFFSKNVQQVFSVEHDELWLELTSEKISKMGFNNWKGYGIGPQDDPLFKQKNHLDPNDNLSSIEAFKGKNFLAYASSIDLFEDNYFDLVMIDGRARISCFIHAKNKVKPGGYIVLDNSERERYKSIHEKLAAEGWEKHNFFGPGPYVNYEFWQTTVWQRKY